MIFNRKKEEKQEEKLITITIKSKYQKLLTLITFNSQDSFSDAINSLLDVNNEKNDDEVQIAISELTYLKLKVIMSENNYKDFNELFKNLLC